MMVGEKLAMGYLYEDMDRVIEDAIKITYGGDEAKHMPL
jgi:hypothetical protein